MLHVLLGHKLKVSNLELEYEDKMGIFHKIDNWTGTPKLDNNRGFISIYYDCVSLIMDKNGEIIGVCI